jgi:hypothetical protein
LKRIEVKGLKINLERRRDESRYYIPLRGTRLSNKCSEVQYSAVQNSTVQSSTLQCSTVEDSTVQCSTVLTVETHGQLLRTNVSPGAFSFSGYLANQALYLGHIARQALRRGEECER